MVDLRVELPREFDDKLFINIAARVPAAIQNQKA